MFVTEIVHISVVAGLIVVVLLIMLLVCNFVQWAERS